MIEILDVQPFSTSRTHLSSLHIDNSTLRPASSPQRQEIDVLERCAFEPTSEHVSRHLRISLCTFLHSQHLPVPQRRFLLRTFMCVCQSRTRRKKQKVSYNPRQMLTEKYFSSVRRDSCKIFCQRPNLIQTCHFTAT